MDDRRTQRFATMDALRGIAAIGVMLNHYTFDRGGSLLPSGPFAVDLFFCLSGFVIAYGYGAKLDAGFGFADFARARIVRLYPMYFVGLALGVASYLANLKVGGASNATALIALAAINGVLLLPTFLPIAIGLGAEHTNRVLFPFNGPAWSLFDELVCNALYAIHRPRGLWLVMTIGAGLVMFIFTAELASGPGGWGRLNWWAGPPRALFAFYLGVGLHDLWRAGWLNFRLKAPWIPLAAIAAAMFAPDRVGIFLLLATVLAPVAVALAIEGPGSARSARLFDRLGSISYPLYATHLPLLGLLRIGYAQATGASPAAPTPLGVDFVFAGVAILLSVGLADIVDGPARAWLAKAWKRPAQKARPISVAATELAYVIRAPEFLATRQPPVVSVQSSR